MLRPRATVPLLAPLLVVIAIPLGVADSEGDFQTPRTFRFSLGVRF